MANLFLNPFTDYGFKRLFGTEANKGLLIDFLNSLLPTHHQIADLEFKNTEQLGQNQSDRKAIYDIYCQSHTGEQFIVELQRTKQDYFKDRTLYYTSLAISEQAKRGRWNYQITAVYCVSILDFCFDEHLDDDDVIHTIKLKDQHGRIFYDKLTLIYLEMPKFQKSEHELATHLDKWLFYFKNLKDLQMIPTAFNDNAIFQEAFKIAELANLTHEEWQKYQYSLKTYRDNLATDSYLHEQGKKEGIIQIAKLMKSSGEPTDKIAQYTNLSADEIDRL